MTNKAEQPILAWHFIGADRTLGYRDGRRVQVGETLSVEGELELCARGLHASRRVLDALGYASNSAIMVCRVECWGDVIEGDDKLVARHRKVLWMYDASKVLHQFSVDAAREAMDLYAKDSDDPAIQKANLAHRHLLDLKQQWISGELTDDEWDAARAAARAAAWDAAWDAARAAARDAARDAAWDAAWDAARDAAWDAAWAAARAAAWAAAFSRLNARLESMLMVGARELVAEVGL